MKHEVPPMKSRRSVIESALNESLKPKPPGGRPVTDAEWKAAAYLTPLQLAGEIVRRERDSAVGGMTKLLYSLSPQDQQIVRHVANQYASKKELGGDHAKKLLEQHQVDPELADAVLAGLEKDYVAAELQSRRRTQSGHNDLELPALTRRDHLEAALDAHAPTPKPKLSEATQEYDEHVDKLDKGRSYSEQPRETRDNLSRME